MPDVKSKADAWLAKNNALTTWIFLAVVAAPIAWLVLTKEKSPEEKTQAPAPMEARGIDSKEAKELAALMINLNKHLCAEVIEIRPLQVNNAVHEVTCIEYRGGTGKKTYLIDTEKGIAWAP